MKLARITSTFEDTTIGKTMQIFINEDEYFAKQYRNKICIKAIAETDV